MQLRDYQKRISKQAAAILQEYGCCYLSMECRTGKTITALDTARRFKATNVLFITKKKAIPSVKSDYKLMLQNGTIPFALDVLNYESAHKAKSNHDFVVLDESHSIGAYPRPSKRAEAVKEICRGLPVLFLSGTPSPESYSQLFHQFWVTDYSPFASYKNFYRWANHFVKIRQKKVNGYYINDYSRADIRKIDAAVKHLFISYTQKDAGFCSTVSEREVVVPMSDTTRNSITRLWRDKVITIDGRDILGDTPAKMLGKLHQLSSGTVIAESGEVIVTDRSKAEYIRQNFNGRLAIFYVYNAERDLLRSVFPDSTESPEDFQNDSCKTFICQVRKAREGIRLDKADHLIFYNLEYSYLSYEQGKNRVVSRERSGDADVVFLCSDCGIDKEILKAVRQKRDFTLHYYQKQVGNGETA